MTTSREEHRREARSALEAAEMEGDVARTNDLLKALAHAVLALSAPTDEELKNQAASDRLREELRRGRR